MHRVTGELSEHVLSQSTLLLLGVAQPLAQDLAWLPGW